MDKQSTLYQLMGMRMNGVMNGITEQDEDYQTLLRAVDEYSDKLEALHFPAEVMKLITLSYALGIEQQKRHADLLVLDTCRYGFVKPQYFHPPCGYDETDIFTFSQELFNDLWNKWLTTQLLALTKGIPWQT